MSGNQQSERGGGGGDRKREKVVIFKHLPVPEDGNNKKINKAAANGWQKKITEEGRVKANFL